MKKLILIFLCLSPFIFAQTKSDSSLAESYRPGDHELLLMPSAYTMEKGQSYFSDYELFLINYTVAVTGRTHLSVFSLFPVTTDFLDTFTLGIKQNYYQTPTFASAAWLTYTPKGGLLNIGNVVSFGRRGKSLHVGLGGLSISESQKWELTYMFGGRYDLSRRFSLLAEYSNSETGLNNDFKGFISFGIRFKGEYIAWDFAGFRPLENTGDLLFLPLIKATIVF